MLEQSPNMFKREAINSKFVKGASFIFVHLVQTIQSKDTLSEDKQLHFIM